MKFLSFLIITVVICFSSCSKFDDLNKDPTRPTTASTSQLLLFAEKNATDILYNSIVNNRVGMHYAQYWSATDRKDDSKYGSSDGGSSTLWSLYSVALPALKEIETLNSKSTTESNAVDNQNAISGILQVWIYHMLTDAFGNVPYKEVLTETSFPKYDDAASIYTDLLTRLDNYEQQLDPNKPSFSSGDVIYKGDVTKWKKLANSLILRIAMRMSEVNPEKAKPIIEKAVSNGVIQMNEEEAIFPYIASAIGAFPYNNLDRDPIEFVVSATLIDFLKELKDPRLPMYARTVSGQYIGSPYGAGDNNASESRTYSLPSTKVYSPNFPGIIVSAAEVQFLLAEAAAKGMNVNGNPETFYKAGITANMKFWGVSSSDADDYINSVPYNNANWKNIIGSQKWIAMYMQGLQSWFERLRLNFTKPDGTPLFIRPIAGSLDPTVSLVPNRITYPTSEDNTNKANKEAATKAIGGDTKGTKLWWQK